MRIHSDKLSAMHIIQAVQRLDNGSRVAEITRHGSRLRANSFDVFLTGHGMTGGQWGNTSGEKTASWDEWGEALAALYEIDPELTLKPYPTREDFERITDGRFPLGAEPAHHNHRWQYAYSDRYGRYFSCNDSKAIDCSASMTLSPIRGIE